MFFFPNSTRFRVRVTYMNGTYNGTFFLGPVTWGLGEGPKGQIYLISITKSISKIFILNFACLLTNERYKTYKTGFSYGPLGHACPRVWDLGVLGSKI